jgi:hypothetical protein
VLQVTTERMIRELLAAETGEDMSPRKAVVREQASAEILVDRRSIRIWRPAMCWVQSQISASVYDASGCLCQQRLLHASLALRTADVINVL